MQKIILLSCFFILLAVGVFVFLQSPKFGRLPSGARLEKIRLSPNYVAGQFVNQHPQPDLSEGESLFTIYRDFIFAKGERTRPIDAIPSLKTKLAELNPQDDVLVWFSHSSYFMQLNGKRILVDPLLSESVSPLPFSMKSFAGSMIYTAADLPSIDYVFITHDHWDHLNYQSILDLKGKTKTFITTLGVGAHLERWGVEPAKILETDWYDRRDLGDGFVSHTRPTHHFSGRSFTRNKTLWASFVLETPTQRVYFGGDSGRGAHFAEIGATFGSIDLAILENGQYDKRWKYVHMQPEEVLNAAKELHAKTLLPVHSGRFSISFHAWDDPLRRIFALAKSAPSSPRLITPKIGERVDLQNKNQSFTPWWEGRR